MILLGLLALTGALADSKVGARLRPPAPPAPTASLAGIDRITVTAGTGHIQVIAEDRPDLSVTLHGSDPGQVAATLTPQGTQLEIHIKSPWWHRVRFNDNAYVVIHLPQTYHQSLSVNATQGRLLIAGPATLETLSLTLQTGLVEIRNVTAATDLRLVTGQLDLAHFTGPLQARLTTGKLTAQFDGLTGPVTVQQTRGQLTLDLPAGAGYTLDAQVKTGALHNDLPANDGPHPVTLRLDTGTITIK